MSITVPLLFGRWYCNDHRISAIWCVECSKKFDFAQYSATERNDFMSALDATDRHIIRVLRLNARI
ncbi:MAG: hypothetical protein ACK4M6_16505, partial [Hyphomonas sp.]